jgi:hypothetical protein
MDHYTGLHFGSCVPSSKIGRFFEQMTLWNKLHLSIHNAVISDSFYFSPLGSFIWTDDMHDASNLLARILPRSSRQISSFKGFG